MDKTPEWVKTKLLEGENVVSNISVAKADCYATDKRLLVFRGKADYQVLEYDKISISFMNISPAKRIGGTIGLLFILVLSLVPISLGIAGIFMGSTF